MSLFAAHQQAEGYLRRVLAHLLPIAAQDVNFCVCNSLNILSLAEQHSIPSVQTSSDGCSEVM